MRIAGIVAEYNPFHRGHAHHIRETRRLTGCDYVVACMAGHFTQRGEPAALSKWARARMALSCGVDAVFELPALFAVRPADAFALGGVGVLGGLGVDAVSFGSEIPDAALLERLAGLREREPETLSEGVRRRLEAGMAHARAWGEAAGELLGLAPETLCQPNLALAVEYVRALKREFPGVEAVAVPRLGAYHDEGLGPLASAGAIRAAFARGESEAALAAIPEAARPWATPDALHPMDDLLMFRLRALSPEALRALPGVGEGLEHRLYRLCRETAGREALLEALKCRRYTRARLSRLLTHALLGVDRALVEAHPMPAYARLIGVREGAEPLLAELKRRATLPIVPSPGALRGDPCFQLECRATDLWALLHDAPEFRLSGREFREKFVKTGAVP